MYLSLSHHVRCLKYLNSVHYFNTQMPCCPCMDNMAKSFPFTIGSPVQLRHKWKAKTHQYAHAETTHHSFFYTWPNDIDECRLSRFRHVKSFWIKLNRFQSGCMVYSKCWICGHMAFHRVPCGKHKHCTPAFFAYKILPIKLIFNFVFLSKDRCAASASASTLVMVWLPRCFKENYKNSLVYVL